MENLYLGMKNSTKSNEKKLNEKKYMIEHPEFDSQFYYKNFCKAIGIAANEKG